MKFDGLALYSCIAREGANGNFLLIMTPKIHDVVMYVHVMHIMDNAFEQKKKQQKEKVIFCCYIPHTNEFMYSGLSKRERDTHKHIYLSILLRMVHAIKTVAANDVIANGRTGERDGTHQIHNAIKSQARQRLSDSSSRQQRIHLDKSEAPKRTDIMNPNLIQYAHFLCEVKQRHTVKKRRATAQRIRKNGYQN